MVGSAHRTAGRWASCPVTAQQSMRRCRAHGYPSQPGHSHRVCGCRKYSRSCVLAREWILMLACFGAASDLLRSRNEYAVSYGGLMHIGCARVPDVGAAPSPRCVCRHSSESWNPEGLVSPAAIAGRLIAASAPRGVLLLFACAKRSRQEVWPRRASMRGPDIRMSLYIKSTPGAADLSCYASRSAGKPRAHIPVRPFALPPAALTLRFSPRPGASLPYRDVLIPRERMDARSGELAER